MTNEEMARILDRFESGYPVEVSIDESEALKAGAAALRAHVQSTANSFQCGALIQPGVAFDFDSVQFWPTFARAERELRGWDDRITKVLAIAVEVREVSAPPEGV